MKTNQTQENARIADEAALFIIRETGAIFSKHVLAAINKSQLATRESTLIQALEKIHANAAESPEWIRRVVSEAISA